MKSMTGYAKRQLMLDGKALTIEIKTLNSKQLDLIVKLPSAYRAAELAVRSMLTQLERGKVEVLVSEEKTASGTTHFNTALATERIEELRAWFASCSQWGCAGEQLVAAVMPALLRQPEMWSDHAQADITADDEALLLAEMQRAIDDVQAFRQHEGDVLAVDIEKHVAEIEKRMLLVPHYEAERIETAKERIRRFFADYTATAADPNRFEQELIYYLEKLDITEEKVRLRKHIDYFRNTAANEPVCGKKLGFIAQEMGREINTTGSKANHVEIQRLVVEMKDELEKIKEQLGNIL